MLRILTTCLLLCLAWPVSARLSAPQVPLREPAGVRDLADIRRSGVLKVLINQSLNSAGEIKGQVVGVEYQRLRALEQQLNRDLAHSRNVRIQLIPKAKGQLLEALRQGEGDVAVPGELFAAGSGRGLSQTLALRTDVPLVVVARKGNRVYSRLEDLSGRTLSLASGSAVSGSLEPLNQRLGDSHRALLAEQYVDESLAVEDVLEMINAGFYLLSAVELPIAQRWARIYPNLRVDSHMVLGRGNQHWYVRRGAVNLLARLDRFIKHYESTDDRDVNLQRAYRRAYRLHNILGRVELQRLSRVRPVLERYAREYKLDWSLLAAIAYKESTLNPNARGAGGALGLMQVSPATARSMGISNATGLDANVLAAAKYLSHIRSRYFSSPRIPERERLGFMLAAYNMGPQRVEALRAEARRRGLDANRWFFQVERVALDQIGLGVASYVSAVNKYALVYQHQLAR